MDRKPSVPRSGVRKRLPGHAVYRQGDCRGQWRLLDLSEGGFQAAGDIGELELSKDVIVRIRHGDRDFSARVVNVWRRRTPGGDCLHGWEIAELSDDASVGLELTLDAGAERAPLPSLPKARPEVSAAPAPSTPRIPWGAWVALLSLTAALVAGVITLYL
ncbi:MAG TPA: PilZ domain-containing protein [Myxococcota bacterium]|nr:PilZ domain-containing protein [Myxococcota bacterium]